MTQENAPGSRIHRALESHLTWLERSKDKALNSYEVLRPVAEYVEQEYADSLITIHYTGYWHFSLKCSTLEEAGKMVADICRKYNLRIKVCPQAGQSSTTFQWLVQEPNTMTALGLELSPSSCQRIQVGEETVPKYKVVCH